VALVALAFHSL